MNSDDELLDQCIEEIDNLFKFDIIINDPIDYSSRLLLKHLEFNNKIHEFSIYKYPNIPEGIKITKITFPTIYHPKSNKIIEGFINYDSILQQFSLKI